MKEDHNRVYVIPVSSCGMVLVSAMSEDQAEEEWDAEAKQWYNELRIGPARLATEEDKKRVPPAHNYTE